jgi:hypothetical protein
MATKCSLLLPLPPLPLLPLPLPLVLLLGLATTVGRGELNAPTPELLPLLVKSRRYSMHLHAQQTTSSIAQQP